MVESTICISSHRKDHHAGSTPVLGTSFNHHSIIIHLMKKILIIIATLLLLTVWATAQKSAPIEVYNAGELVFSMSEDSVVINGVMPITMNCINYYIHQYDDLTGVHYFGVAYQQEDGCSRFDQEFSLWITEDLKYYYSYIDSCEGFLLWKGNYQLAESFRAENQYQSIKNHGSSNK